MMGLGIAGVAVLIFGVLYGAGIDWAPRRLPRSALPAPPAEPLPSARLVRRRS